MNNKKLAIEFVTVFAVALVTVAMVTFLWNIIGHGESSVDWKHHSVLLSCSALS